MGSSALVGSSSSSTLGLVTSAAAIATLCCSPPLSSEIALRRNGASAKRSKTSSTLLRIISGATPSVSKPKAISSSTRSDTKPFTGFWPTIPTTSANSPGLSDRVDLPATEISPERIPPV